MFRSGILASSRLVDAVIYTADKFIRNLQFIIGGRNIKF